MAIIKTNKQKGIKGICFKVNDCDIVSDIGMDQSLMFLVLPFHPKLYKGIFAS
jgi:hypothetical protein